MTELLSARPAPFGAGDDGIDGDLVCAEVVQVTHDVRSFVLQSPDRRTLGFRAGQHLTVEVVVDGVRLERCYTISSAATRPDQVTLTVKRVPGGPVSGWLHDWLGVGDRLRVSGPLGRFTLEEHPARRHLMLSAGSGITPLMSMLRTMRDGAGTPVDVVFVHSARTPADIVFRDELEQLDAEGAGVRVVTVCESDAGDPRWRGHLGRLGQDLIERAVPDLLDREVFVCGPAGYRDSVRQLLLAAGVDPARCHEESFVLGEPSVLDSGSGPWSAAGGATVPAPDQAVPTYAVELRRSGRMVTCDARTSVLEAAARAGVQLPSSCGEGVCGTCKTTLLEGTVDMQHGGGIRPREIARQQILVCCSTPLEDLVIDV